MLTCRFASGNRLLRILLTGMNAIQFRRRRWFTSGLAGPIRVSQAMFSFRRHVRQHVTRLTNVKFEVGFFCEEDGGRHYSAFLRWDAVHLPYTQVFWGIVLIIGLYEIRGIASCRCVVLDCNAVRRQDISHVRDSRHQGRSSDLSFFTRDVRFNTGLASYLGWLRLLFLFLVVGSRGNYGMAVCLTRGRARARGSFSV